MNLIDEILSLPRRSQIELAAMILKKFRPTLDDLADAGGVSGTTAARWFLTRQEREATAAKDRERYHLSKSKPMHPDLSARMDASIAALLNRRNAS